MSEAGGADDGSPVNDFTEEPGEAQSPQMRLEAVSPRTAVMCSWLQTWRFFYFLRTNIVYLLSNVTLGHFTWQWEFLCFLFAWLLLVVRSWILFYFLFSKKE